MLTHRCRHFLSLLFMILAIGFCQNLEHFQGKSYGCADRLSFFENLYTSCWNQQKSPANLYRQITNSKMHDTVLSVSFTLKCFSIAKIIRNCIS